MVKREPKKSSAERNRSAEEIVCGFHGVRSLLTEATEPASADIIEVLVDQQRHDQRKKELQHDFEQAGIRCRQVSRDELDQLAGETKHQGVIARVTRTTKWKSSDLYPLLDQLDHHALLLILDQVQDPHNLGACLRTADGAGVDAVILPKNGACSITPTVVRVAAGAANKLPVFYVSNLARTMSDLQQRGIWTVGGDDSAESTLYEADFNTDIAIVMGAEGGGLRRLTREHCDRLVRIPMSGNVSSLNVSVASGLFLFEAVRQRSAT